MEPHPKPARGRCRDPYQVRLHGAGHQDRVRTLYACLAEVELELAYLVAAERQPRAIVALYPELASECCAQVRSGLQRRRRMAEPDPREAGDAGKGTGHCGCGPMALLQRSARESRIASREVPTPADDCKGISVETPLCGGAAIRGDGGGPCGRSTGLRSSPMSRRLAPCAAPDAVADKRCTMLVTAGTAVDIEGWSRICSSL